MVAIIRIVLFLILTFFLSCAEEFVPENPIDPDNPEYIPPIISIVSGPTEGQMLLTSSIVVEFSGNETSMLFRTKLDSNNWSGWFSSQSTTLDYLDEGDHLFSVQGRYTTGDTSAVISIGFSVDAVEGPALLFHPRRHTAATGETVTFQVLLEEVYNMTGTEFVLDYNPSKMSIEDVRQGDLFNTIGTPIFFSEFDLGTGRLTITSAVWAGDVFGFTGTGVIAEIDVKLLQDGSTTIGFDGSEEMRGPENNEIGILETVGGLLSNP